MEEKNKQPKDLQTALDCAVRCKSGNEAGYVVKKIKYYNYMSNKAWESYLEKMDPTHQKQYGLGAGGELKAGQYPPKMASFGSSSRLIYELSRKITGFNFEEKFDTRVGGIANLDGFLKKENKYIYVEAKRREIYGASHVNQKIKVVYKDVYDYIKDKNLGFDYETKACIDKDKEEYFKCTFKIDGKPVEFFDLKQLICHFLGITYDIVKNGINNANVKFLYLIFNPEKVENNIDERYRKNIITRYKEVKDFIEGNIKVIIQIFYTVLEYQLERQKLPRVEINFEYELVDQNSYKDELK